MNRVLSLFGPVLDRRWAGIVSRSVVALLGINLFVVPGLMAQGTDNQKQVNPVRSSDEFPYELNESLDRSRKMPAPAVPPRATTESDAGPAPLLVEVELPLSRRGNGKWVAANDPEDLVFEAKTKYRVKVTVVNQTNETFEFSGFDKRSTEVQFRVADRRIPPKARLRAEIVFDTPLGTEDGRYAQQVFLLDEQDQTVGYLTVHCRLTGEMRCRQNGRGLVLFVGDQVSEYRVPFQVTPPLSIEQLEVVEEEPFENSEVMAELDAVDEHTADLVLMVHPDSFSGDYVAGRWVVRPKGDDHRKIEIPLLVSRAKAFEISPRTLRFVRRSDDPETMTAACVVRIRPAGDEAALDDGETRGEGKDQSPESDELPEWEAQLADGTRLPLKVVPLTDTLFRVRINVDKSVIANSAEKSILWKFQFGDRSYRHRSFFTLED